MHTCKHLGKSDLTQTKMTQLQAMEMDDPKRGEWINAIGGEIEEDLTEEYPRLLQRSSPI
jgi:hypothetical protein